MEKTSSCIYNINYHIVFCPKYRKSVLKGKIKEFLEECIETIADARGFKILEKEIMPDHVHLFISAPPQYSPTAIVKVLKGVTSLRLSKRFPEVKLWKGRFWSSSYYIGTAGHVSAKTIERYIQEQKSRQLRNSSTQ